MALEVVDPSRALASMRIQTGLPGRHMFPMAGSKLVCPAYILASGGDGWSAFPARKDTSGAHQGRASEKAGVARMATRTCPGSSCATRPLTIRTRVLHRWSSRPSAPLEAPASQAHQSFATPTRPLNHAPPPPPAPTPAHPPQKLARARAPGMPGLHLADTNLPWHAACIGARLTTVRWRANAVVHKPKSSRAEHSGRLRDPGTRAWQLAPRAGMPTQLILPPAHMPPPLAAKSLPRPNAIARAWHRH